VEPLKLIHVITVGLSISGFTLRGIWMIRHSALLQSKWVRILPHINDTILLVSAVALVIQKQYPISSPWLVAKIIALLLYIGLGMVAFRLGKTRAIKITAYAAAISVFVYIALVATFKTPFLFV